MLADRPATLSRREREVLVLMAEGLVNKQIAARLIVSPDTVKNHTVSIMRKMNASSRTEAAVRAVRLGLID